jgi:plasmid stabilization system protein ParE
MRIRWTPTAADDLEHIKDYLTEHYPHLARSTVFELYEAIRSLKTFPQRGRPGREPGTHELVFSRLTLHCCLPHQGTNRRSFTHPSCRPEPALNLILISCRKSVFRLTKKRTNGKARHRPSGEVCLGGRSLTKESC